MTECACCGSDIEGEALESKHGPVCSAACLRWLIENDDGDDTESEQQKAHASADAMAQAVAMVRDGTAYGEAARVFGVPRSTLIEKCRRAGVLSKYPPRTALSEPMTRAIAMIRDGSPMAVAAKACGLGPKRVSEYCRRHNIEARTEEKSA